ncbi:MAG: hypothetical protein QM703_28280 [Gemmatales bacterium]
MPRVKDKQSFQQTVTMTPTVNVRTEAEASPPVVKPQQHLYFVNAPVDYLIIGLGSILTFLALLAVFGTEAVPLASTIAGWLVYVVNYPHFAATNYRLYHNKENIRQYPITALVIPWVILAGMIGSFYSPNYIAVSFLMIFLYWSPYHFSGQTLGITLIYARRAGFFVGKWERFTLANLIYATFLYMTARGEAITAASDLILPPEYSIERYRLGLPMWVSQVILVWMVINAAGFLYLIAKWCKEQKKMLPLIVLLPVVTQIVWFIPGSYVKSFYLLVPMFHSLQYLLIAWSLQLKEKMDMQKITPSVDYVVKESIRWGSINLVLGALLFTGIPYAIHFVLQDVFDINYPFVFVLGIMIAGVQIHHFFVDGVIWKLKKKTVASPLMVNLDDLIHAPSDSMALAKGA